jgi:putative hydrolase of the HAD superfamily
MSLLQFKALTLDVVGTLIDFERGMLDFLHQAVPDAHVMGSDFLVAYREARASPLALCFPNDLERVWKELAHQFGLPPQAAAAFRSSVEQWPAFADSVAALRRLRKHYRLVAATNAQRWAMDHFERTLGMSFDWTVTCDDARREKPDPRYFVWMKDMLASQGIRQAETLHVGQSQYHDIGIAQALGWRTCWIERRAGLRGWGACRPALRPVKPDWHFTTLSELADAVEAEALELRQSTALPLFPEIFEMSPA